MDRKYTHGKKNPVPVKERDFRQMRCLNNILINNPYHPYQVLHGYVLLLF
jgi:hypothetical protein